RLNKFAFGVRGSGRLKIYLNHDLDYVTGGAEVFLRFPQILKLNNEIALSAAGLNYQNFTVFDYSENLLIWRISRRVSSRINLSVELTGKQVRYDTTEVDIPEESASTFRKIKRTDDNYKAKFQVSYSKSYLINFSYTFQHNDSNNPALVYSKHQFTLIFGFPLSSTVWLRGYGAAQLKDYTEEAVPSFPTDVDTEREQSNFFILDVSKDLNPNLTALLRLAYYNNESIIRSRFYRKTLVTLGVDFRF
ncbi:hypothetical protein GWO43_02425, partial [candidate division KSB1 bacterium]|nr:hypothetical protein [candidate division KSB1 bacterium]NIR69721.1 hypothetical protein [candidate division KSB1 bacterium]NIS22909.1 hypothetical protein [candidate division KSB1 bacterium]NIT69766.1 hypothetical protein [candidate division KSB1 bacterium]NIU23440.1 hypothetical protein [candidate division KSB1 bacterium]